jgi:HTH-type transcriptional regulator/antitoxin HigA
MGMLEEFIKLGPKHPRVVNATLVAVIIVGSIGGWFWIHTLQSQLDEKDKMSAEKIAIAKERFNIEKERQNDEMKKLKLVKVSLEQKVKILDSTSLGVARSLEQIVGILEATRSSTKDPGQLHNLETTIKQLESQTRDFNEAIRRARDVSELAAKMLAPPPVRVPDKLAVPYFALLVIVVLLIFVFIIDIVQKKQKFFLRPIKTEADYQAALAEIKRLHDADPGTAEGDRLEVLMTLVEIYEEQHYSISLPDPVEAIIYHMESRGLLPRDLEPYIGSSALVDAVLRRQQPLSIDMIRRLQAGLGISADILIQPYSIFKSAD